jgi:formylglycine-generating enzyme required for sulfatase activity
MTTFHFGSQSNGRETNVGGDDPYGTSEKGPDLRRTTTVGSYPPNAFVLHDMLGNVFEWCSDWFDKDYYMASPIDDPLGPSRTGHRVARGGAWNEPARHCRSASRTRFTLIYRSLIVGFRVAADAPGK